jgi:DNA-binding response OmpR family regulator
MACSSAGVSDQEKQAAANISVKPHRPNASLGQPDEQAERRFGEVSARTGTFRAVRILVVEDEIELADAVATGLRREGYAVDVANDVAGAIDRLVVSAYDVVTLDLNLPDGDGLELARRIREDPAFAPLDDEAAPRILMLTARDGVGERVVGLDQGADDYLVKPFAFAELSARVRSLLRRDAGRSGATLTVGELQLDTARFEATRRGRLLDLTAKEFALLRYFMAHSGEVLSQERLLEHVWDENADPLTNTVRVTVGTLRRKLTREDDVEAPIETVIGAGYRLRPDLLAAPATDDA